MVDDDLIDSEDGPTWALFALSAEGGAARVKQLTQVRILTAEECEDADVATRVLSALTAESPYEDLVQTYREFLHLLDHPPRTTADAFRYGADTRRRFRHWLSDFRSFADRTSAWLSRTFEEGHPARDQFESALRAEYDANFAYRLASALRNLSAHAANMLNHQMWHVSTDADGRVQLRPVLAIDGSRLADAFPKMKASVRRELHEVEGLLDVRAVVDAGMKSCLRAHAALALALWEEIGPERTLVTEFHRSAVAAGGQDAVFVNMDTFDPNQGHVDHRYNPHHLLEQARSMRDLAESLAPLPVVDVAANELLHDD